MKRISSKYMLAHVHISNLRQIVLRAYLYLQAAVCLQQVPIALCIIRILKRNNAIPQLQHRQEGTAIWPLPPQNLRVTSIDAHACSHAQVLSTPG